MLLLSVVVDDLLDCGDYALYVFVGHHWVERNAHDAFIDAQYKEVKSLYHLDQRSAGGASGEKKDLGPLPFASKALLTVLVLAWVLIGLAAFREYNKKK